MSDNIPFDIQTEIMQRLPVQSLVRFQRVSKQWKSLINSIKFINDHTHINRKQSQRHLLVRHKLNRQDPEYTSIVDDDTFPNQKSSVTLPPPLSLMNDSRLEKLNSVNGLLCFYGYNTELKTSMFVIWNPTIRKTVGIPIPSKNESDVFGFGFCRDSSDPKLVKIKGGNIVHSGGVSYWEVDVFTLSSRVWKTVSKGRPPICACLSNTNHVCIDGFIYWAATYYSNDQDCKYCNSIISFDLKSEEFGRVCLPDRLLQSHMIIAEVNESLGVLHYNYDYDEEVEVCDVWMMDFVTKSFAKMFTVKLPVPPLYGVFSVLGFRKNGEVIVEVQEDGRKKSRLEVYEPSSGRINRIWINGKSYEQHVNLYMETLLLLDQTSSIIP